MFKIRNEQVQALDAARRRDFENEMVQHLASYAPKLCEVAGQISVRSAIQRGMERAERHGFENRGPMRLYLELMALYGCDFDSDPLLPWAARVLGDPTIPGQSERADRLHQEAIRYLRQVAGPNGCVLIDGLRRLQQADPDTYLTIRGDHEAEALHALRTIYPERCRLTSESALRTLIRQGLDRASRLPGSGTRGIALFVALPLALGHGYATDPFYPWIAKTLDDPRITDPIRRVDRLYQRAMAYLSAVVSHLEGQSHAQ